MIADEMRNFHPLRRPPRMSGESATAELGDQKGVREPLVAYRRRLAMTGMQDCLVGERQDVATNRGHQRLEVAPRQIGSADRASEHAITDHRHPGAYQNNVTWGMPWRVVHLHPAIAKPNFLTFSQVFVYGRKRIQFQAEQLRLFGSSLVERYVIAMQMYRSAGRLLCARQPVDVVEVRMRQDDRFDIHLSPFGYSQRLSDRCPRIDQNSLLRGGALQKVAVLSEPASREAADQRR
jgi:hypothetical protein